MSQNTPGPEGELLLKQLVGVGQIHVNVTQVVIVTTEDKLRICLTDHLKRVEARKEWITPFGILLTVLITLATTSFKDFVLPSQSWNVIFLLAAAASLGWLLWALRLTWRSIRMDDLIVEIKRS